MMGRIARTWGRLMCFDSTVVAGVVRTLGVRACFFFRRCSCVDSTGVGGGSRKRRPVLSGGVEPLQLQQEDARDTGTPGSRQLFQIYPSRRPWRGQLSGARRGGRRRQRCRRGRVRHHPRTVARSYCDAAGACRSGPLLGCVNERACAVYVCPDLAFIWQLLNRKSPLSPPSACCRLSIVDCQCASKQLNRRLRQF